jgi:hypothetical protein
MTVRAIESPTVIASETDITGPGLGAIVVYASPEVGPAEVLVYLPGTNTILSATLAEREIKGRRNYCAVFPLLCGRTITVTGPSRDERVTHVDWRRVAWQPNEPASQGAVDPGASVAAFAAAFAAGDRP